MNDKTSPMTPEAMLSVAGGRAYELVVSNMLAAMGPLPKSGREIYEALNGYDEPLSNISDNVLSCIAALDDPNIHPAITRMIFHRYTLLAAETRKRAPHRPGGLPATLRLWVDLRERVSGGLSRDEVAKAVARDLGLPASKVLAALRDKPGRKKKKPCVGN